MCREKPAQLLVQILDLLRMNWDQSSRGWDKLGQLRRLNWFLMSFRSWDLIGWFINWVYFELTMVGGKAYLDLKCYNKFYGGLRCRIRGQWWQIWGWQRRRGGQSEWKNTSRDYKERDGDGEFHLHKRGKRFENGLQDNL